MSRRDGEKMVRTQSDQMSGLLCHTGQLNVWWLYSVLYQVVGGDKGITLSNTYCEHNSVLCYLFQSQKSLYIMDYLQLHHFTHTNNKINAMNLLIGLISILFQYIDIKLHTQ